MPDQTHSQDEYVCYFREFPESKFTSMSGGEFSNETSLEHKGGGDKTVIEGPAEVTEVTLRKHYDHAQDQGLDQWNKAWQNGKRQKLTLVKQPVNSEGTPVGQADTYLRCSRSSYKKPDVSSGSSDAAMLEVTVQPEDVQ